MSIFCGRNKILRPVFLALINSGLATKKEKMGTSGNSPLHSSKRNSSAHVVYGDNQPDITFAIFIQEQIGDSSAICGRVIALQVQVFKKTSSLIEAATGENGKKSTVVF